MFLEEMENVIYQGGEAAVARIHVDGTVTEAELTILRSSEAILGATTASIQ